MPAPTLTLTSDESVSFVHPFPFERKGFGTLENLTANVRKEAAIAAHIVTHDYKPHTSISLGVVSNKLFQLAPVLENYAMHFDQLIVNWTNGQSQAETYRLEDTLYALQERFAHLRGNITLQKSTIFNNDFARTREDINDASKHKWVFHLDDDEQIPQPLLAAMPHILEFMDYSHRTVVGIPRITYIDGVRVTPQNDEDWQYRIVTKDERYQHPVHAQPKCLFTPHKNKYLVVLVGTPLIHSKTTEQHNYSQDLYREILPGSESPKITSPLRKYA